MSMRTFLLIAALYQVIFMFQGMDFLDEGFTATFYQQFFHDPSSVQYNFMYWLSGLVGGVFVSLFPDTGMLGLRFLSILFTTASIVIVYNLLKDYLNRGYLKIGLLLVLMCACHNPKIFHYNFLSVLLYTGTASLLFNGLRKDRLVLLIAAGTLVGLDVFARLPSIVNLGLLLAIAWWGYVAKTALKRIMVQCIAFIAGFCLAVAAVLLLIRAMGHLDVFINAFRLVTQMGHSDGESAYGIMILIRNFLTSYNDALIFTLYIIGLIIISAVAPRWLTDQMRLPAWIGKVVKYLSLLIACLIMLKGLEILMRWYVGLALISFVLIMLSRASKEIKTLMLIGTYITATYAFGSSAGIFTAGIHIFWISVPIAFDYILGLKTFDFRLNMTTNHNTVLNNDAFVKEPQFRLFKTAVVVISIIGCLYHQWFYPLHDESSRLGMFYSVDNKYVKGILTTKERVQATNDLLKASEEFIKPGDYVLAFHSLPIFHYMTKTRPYTRNPMPWYYVSGAFKDQLYRAVDETKILPVVVMQKVKTTPNDHGAWPDLWPTDSIFHQPDTDIRTIRQKQYMEEFLNKFNYRVGWENDLFKIMITDRKVLPANNSTE